MIKVDIGRYRIDIDPISADIDTISADIDTISSFERYLRHFGTNGQITRYIRFFLLLWLGGFRTLSSGEAQNARQSFFFVTVARRVFAHRILPRLHESEWRESTCVVENGKLCVLVLKGPVARYRAISYRCKNASDTMPKTCRKQPISISTRYRPDVDPNTTTVTKTTVTKRTNKNCFLIKGVQAPSLRFDY